MFNWNGEYLVRHTWDESGISADDVTSWAIDVLSGKAVSIFCTFVATHARFPKELEKNQIKIWHSAYLGYHV